MTNDHLISVLNDLIQISKDGEKGFRTCANDAKELHVTYREFFEGRATACAQTVLDLQDLVHRLGGSPVNHSTLSGALHRRWLDLKTAVTGKDDDAVLDECERAEDVAVQAYRKALSHDLPDDIRLVIERQYQGVLVNHEKVRDLRYQAHSKTAA